MSEKNKLILDLIKEGQSINEISEQVGLSNQQIFNRLEMLKFRGYLFQKKYFWDGNIRYSLNKNLENIQPTLITRQKDQKLKAVFISDTHFGHTKDRIDLLNFVYEYCIKNDIHLIIHGGDLVEGISEHGGKFINPEDQITYLLKNYPFDKSILNFLCLGNHDYTLLEKMGINISQVLEMHRQDLVSLGFGTGKLSIKKDILYVTHPISKLSCETIHNGLVLAGHSHQAKNLIRQNIAKINLPPLSGVMEHVLPGFLSATIFFNQDYFSSICYEQFVFTDKMYKVAEVNCPILNTNHQDECEEKYEVERLCRKNKNRFK